tara:strand:+ start:103 stop:516 length:414 start_codon:yes stop_codon:yes gene_type:complete
MAAGKFSFIIERGATTEFEIIYKDSAGTPVDLSGHIAKMQIKDQRPGETATTFVSLSSSLSADEDYSKTEAVSFISISGSNLTNPVSSGSLGVYIGHAVTNDFTFSKGVYDIELTSGSIRTRLLEGNVTVTQQVTTI